METTKSIRLKKKQGVLYCQLEGHYKRPMMHVCIDSQCKQRTLLCSVCIDSIHVDHERLELEKFLELSKNTPLKGGEIANKFKEAEQTIKNSRI